MKMSDLLLFHSCWSWTFCCLANGPFAQRGSVGGTMRVQWGNTRGTVGVQGGTGEKHKTTQHWYTFFIFIVTSCTQYNKRTWYDMLYMRYFLWHKLLLLVTIKRLLRFWRFVRVFILVTIKASLRFFCCRLKSFKMLIMVFPSYGFIT